MSVVSNNHRDLASLVSLLGTGDWGTAEMELPSTGPNARYSGGENYSRALASCWSSRGLDVGADGKYLWEEVGLYMPETGFQATCSYHHPRESVLLGSLRLGGQVFPTPYSQIQHIRHERTWSASSEADRWRHDGSENESFVDIPPLPSSRKLTLVLV